MSDCCRFAKILSLLAALVFAAGCGTTREHQATEQLVLSDAVDRSIETIDFRPLSGHKVYLDTSYLRSVKGPVFVNADYVISSLRQQMVAAGCLLQDSSQEADLIVEARMGALGADNHRVTYGLPENNAFQNAAALVSDAPRFPILPEIAFARRESREGAAKVAAFAYERETRQAVWQSGISQSIASARDTWVLGVGPFRGGTIRNETKLADHPLNFGEHVEGSVPFELFDRPPVDYTSQVRFQDGWPVLSPLAPEHDLIHQDEIASSDKIADKIARPTRLPPLEKLIEGEQIGAESEIAAESETGNEPSRIAEQPSDEGPIR